MALFIRQKWFLLLVLVVFILCKLPHLYYPYYWDESWPYAPAIKAMCDHGISLMPDAIDAELSRGHPLFFHAIAAGWMKVFGSSLFAMHSFALSISVLFLVAIHEAGLRFFNQRVAVLSLLLVATQVCFFVQSSFVLFEVLIAFLCFLSLCFYCRDQYVLTAICLTMLFYTKESGLIAGFVVGLHALATMFAKSIDWKVRLFRIISVAVPSILIGIFFLLQKHTRGWYVFPLHADIIEHSWGAFWYKFRMTCVRDVFYENFKFYYFLALLVLSAVVFGKTKNTRFLVILLPAVIIYYFIDDMRAGRVLPTVPFFILFVLSVFGVLYTYCSRQFFEQIVQRKFVALSGLFILCFLIFSAMNFYTYRYLQAAIIPLLFLVAVLADMFLLHSYAKLYYPLLLVVILTGFCQFRYNTGYKDVDLGAFAAMDVQQKEVDFLVDHHLREKQISCGSFLTLQHLTNPATRFLHGIEPFNSVKWDIDSMTEYVLFDNIEPDHRYNDIVKNVGFHLVYRFEKGVSWTEVYQRR